MLYQIAYVSTAQGAPSAQSLDDILRVSRSNNGRDEITGLLIFHDRLFFQLLEGPRAAVEACYQRIEADPRHGETRLIWEDTPEARAFPSWQMAFARAEDLGDGTREGVRCLGEMRRDGAARLTADPAVQSIVSSVLADLRDA